MKFEKIEIIRFEILLFFLVAPFLLYFKKWPNELNKRYLLFNSNWKINQLILLTITGFVLFLCTIDKKKCYFEINFFVRKLSFLRNIFGLRRLFFDLMDTEVNEMELSNNRAYRMPKTIRKHILLLAFQTILFAACEKKALQDRKNGILQMISNTIGTL